MPKLLKDILAGLKSSKKGKMNLDDLLMSKEGNAGAKKFIATHEIEKHEDRVGNGDEVFKGKTKKAEYPRQSDGVYEESEESDPASLDEDWKPEVGSVHHFGDEGDVVKVRVTGHHDNAISIQHVNNPKKKDYVSKRDWVGNSSPIKEENEAASSGKKMNEIAMCNHTTEGTYCEMHGKAACPKEDDVNTQPKGKADKKGRQYLADKNKHSVDEASQYRSTYGMGKRGWASSKAKNVTFQNPAYLPSGPKKEDLRAEAEKAKTSGVKVTRLPPGKAKGVKEEVQYIDEVLTSKDPASKWIHDFVHSDNPKFKGKSTKERQRMALGAYYSKTRGGKTRNEQADTGVTFPGKLSATTGGTDLDSTRV